MSAGSPRRWLAEHALLPSGAGARRAARGGRRAVHRGHPGQPRRRRRTAGRCGAARPGRRAQPRLPPRPAGAHARRRWHVLELARGHVRRRRAARPGLLPRAGAGDVRRDGPRRRDLRGRVPLPAPPAGRRRVRRPERDGRGAAPGRRGGGHPDHPAGRVLPRRRAHRRRPHPAGRAAAPVRRRHRRALGRAPARAAPVAGDARRCGDPLGAGGAAREHRCRGPGRRGPAAARAPLGAAGGERRLPGLLRRDPDRRCSTPRGPSARGPRRSTPRT